MFWGFLKKLEAIYAREILPAKHRWLHMGDSTKFSLAKLFHVKPDRIIERTFTIIVQLSIILKYFD